MKQITIFALGILLVGAVAGTALAIDIDTLDKVSVLMPKSQVISLLGNPDEVAPVGNGLHAEIYKVDGMDPLVGTGCIYENGEVLAGQSFIFQGEMDSLVAERLVKLGFTMLEDPVGLIRMVGKDDDTGQPLVAVVSHENGMTTITTFEKSFYDRVVK